MSQVLIFDRQNSSAPNQNAALLLAGFKTHTVKSIPEFQSFLSRTDPNVVCFDSGILGRDCHSALRRWRNSNPQKPVIFTTERDDLEGRALAEQFNAAAYLPKPYSTSRFVELVQHLANQSNTGSSGRSVMMYSHDTIGLGHMRRNSTIAANIANSNKDASVLMLVGSPTGAFFDLGPGVDFIKLPSLVKVGRDQWQPSALRVLPSKVRELRASLIINSVKAFNPDVFLVDHEPAGVWDELVPVLKSFRSMPSPPRVVLGLRDILDDPARTLSAWKKKGITTLIKECYDDILVYGNQDFFDTDNQYDLQKLRPGRVHYCGLVSSIRRSDKACSERSGLIISGGGGRDAAPMCTAVLNALSSMNCHERPQVTLISGPLMDEDVRSDLFRSAERLGLDCQVSVSDLPDRLRRAGMFITMGGYNSLTEALAIQVPTLVIPRTGPSSEQRIRAEKMDSLGMMKVLSIADALPEAIATYIRNPSLCSGDEARSLSLNGANVAADFLIRLARDEIETQDQFEARMMAHG